jgi:hypothetical protein
MPTQLLSAVLSPEAQRTLVADGESPFGKKSSLSSMADRLGTLNGKTVYLVDTGFGGSYKFLEQVQAWFAAHMPAVKTVRKRKSGSIFRDDTTDLWKEIKDKGHAAIVGVAG